MHKRGATFLAPTAFAIADSPLSLSPNGCLPVHSPLNFLSSFLMRALMHMRGSRCFYSKLAAIALSYFFNAPRALISRPPNCENFQTTAGRPKVHSQQPFHLWTSPCVWLLRGRLPRPRDLPLSLGYQPRWAQGKLFLSPMGSSSLSEIWGVLQNYRLNVSFVSWYEVEN